MLNYATTAIMSQCLKNHLRVERVASAKEAVERLRLFDELNGLLVDKGGPACCYDAVISGGQRLLTTQALMPPTPILILPAMSPFRALSSWQMRQRW